MKKQAVETLLIHGRSVEGDETRGIAPPIHMSSSYSFETIEHAEKVMGFESSDYVYTRGNNPTLRARCQALFTSLCKFWGFEEYVSCLLKKR